MESAPPLTARPAIVSDHLLWGRGNLYIYPVSVEDGHLSMFDENDLEIERWLLPLHVETEGMIRPFII